MATEEHEILNERTPSGSMRQWAVAAIPVLEEVAATFGGYITYGDLKERVTAATGIRSNQQLNFWSSTMLNRVIQLCEDRKLPALSSLVVSTADGMVGSGFNEVLRRSGRETVQDDPHKLEVIAAEERLTCYRVYCSYTPLYAEPQLTREYSARVKRERKSQPKARPTCAGCQMQLPAAGLCDYCE